jgi:integrase
MIVELTKSFIDTQLVVPAGEKKIEFCDTNVRGLLIQANATGKMLPTFFLRWKRQGRTAYDRLGTIKELTLAQARKLATEKKVEYAKAAKQAPVVKPVLAEMTMDAFMADHYFPHVKLHKRSWVRDDQLYRIRIKPKFGDTKISELTRYQVQQFQNELSKSGLSPASQDHHIKLIRHALNLAVEWEFIARNVLKGVKLLNVENQLHDVATDDQLQRLVEILRTDHNRPVCNILMFLLSTGARLSEALTATWGQVDTEKGLWTIPASTAKSKKSRTVPLNESALWILGEAEKMEKFDAIFANPETGKPFTTITRVWYRLRKAAGIEKMRIHSCRHQFADLVISSGRSLYDVQVLLGHSDPRVSQRYARLSMHTLKEAANMASLLMPKLKSDTPLPGGVVVPFQKVA